MVANCFEYCLMNIQLSCGGGGGVGAGGGGVGAGGGGGGAGAGGGGVGAAVLWLYALCAPCAPCETLCYTWRATGTACVCMWVRGAPLGAAGTPGTRSEGVCTRLIAIPSFCDTGTAVLFNVNTLEATPITIGPFGSS